MSKILFDDIEEELFINLITYFHLLEQKDEELINLVVKRIINILARCFLLEMTKDTFNSFLKAD